LINLNEEIQRLEKLLKSKKFIFKKQSKHYDLLSDTLDVFRLLRLASSKNCSCVFFNSLTLSSTSSTLSTSYFSRASSTERSDKRQIIMTTENDPVLIQSTSQLAEKYPDNTTIVHMDKNGNYKVVHGNSGRSLST
jgi:hypothetical protein